VSENKEIIFKKPPATEVRAAVQFKNSLEVADTRSRYHDLVRDMFPTILMPERSKLQFDLGDYSLWNEAVDTSLEIGMNYFRLFTRNYSGFSQFSSVFRRSLDAFSGLYGISVFESLVTQYVNQLPLRQGDGFENCFRFDISLPEEIDLPIYAGQGFLALQAPEGILGLRLEPQAEGLTVRSYTLDLIFNVSRRLLVGEGRDEVGHFLEVAHMHIKRVFLGVLNKGYLEYLESRQGT
jgi:uncharacterized protein (TIGR04255 family)